MAFQHWLVRDRACLLAVNHIPAGMPALPPPGAVVLLAGFSHPMCDVDYFMSRLASRLVAVGTFVAQVDLRGHGDSSGELADVDLESLRDDLAFVLEHYRARFANVAVIARGLLATLATELPLAALAGVAPYRLESSVIEAHLATMPSTTDAYTMLPGDDYVAHGDFARSSLAILDALGAVAYNLHGERLSQRLWQQLARFDATAALAAAGDAMWIEGFVRSPTFQQAAITRLTDWVAERVVV